MKLGSQTGSFVNHIRSRQVIGQPEPVVGMGATILLWTDRHAATITEVFVLGKYTYVKVRQDTSKRIDKNGMSEDQDYEFTPNPNGSESCFRREDDGAWAEVRYNADTKRYNKSRGHGLRIGARDEYHDFSF